MGGVSNGIFNTLNDKPFFQEMQKAMLLGFVAGFMFGSLAPGNTIFEELGRTFLIEYFPTIINGNTNISETNRIMTVEEETAAAAKYNHWFITLNNAMT